MISRIIGAIIFKARKCSNFFISEKQPGDDGCVVIEDDCWIGANAIILPVQVFRRVIGT